MRITKRRNRPGWGDIDPHVRAATREALESMQTREGHVFCAYCEGEIHDSHGHIEHLAPRARFPERTFEWTNLFLSCDAGMHCGRYKDKHDRSYEPDEVIHPDADEPDNFFFFSSTGDCEIRAGLSPTDRKRAELTLRVLNLNHEDLRRVRANIGKQLMSMNLDSLSDFEDFEPDEVKEFFDFVVNQFADKPYSSVARHFYWNFVQQP